LECFAIKHIGWGGSGGSSSSMIAILVIFLFFLLHVHLIHLKFHHRLPIHWPRENDVRPSSSGRASLMTYS
jgi:hypothetical protein